MRSGSLKHKITLQTYSESQNDYGEVAKSWVDFKSVYASITPLSAKEFFKEGMRAEATHRIDMRYIGGVKPKMRVAFGDRMFDIKSVINIREENKTLRLICEEWIDE